MNKKIYTTIVGTGSYIPSQIVKNEDFLDSEFFNPVNGEKIDKANEEIIQKFKDITNIEERRFAGNDETTSDLAFYAAKKAIESANYNPEELDFIIVSHNFGDVLYDNQQSDVMPAIANRVKKKLGIENPVCYTHDVIAGCPGWTTAMIVANAYLTSGTYRKGMVIGSDVNSRHGDPYDRDRMIFADGAGAVIVEATESEIPVGVLAQSSRSDVNGLDWLVLRPSLNKMHDQKELFIRMMGNKVYAYSLSTVPGVVKDSLDKAGLDLKDVKKVLIHQANEKMDEAIIARTFKLYGIDEFNPLVMPMTIKKLGNSSTATIPTLFDLILKGKMKEHSLQSGDVVIFTSVGAGMNINSIVYKMP